MTHKSSFEEVMKKVLLEVGSRSTFLINLLAEVIWNFEKMGKRKMKENGKKNLRFAKFETFVLFSLCLLTK